MSVRVPNHMLAEAVTINMGPHDVKTLPAGAFVKPIDWRWLPKHLLDSFYFMWSNKDDDIPCYTQIGIVPIPRNKLRVV